MQIVFLRRGNISKDDEIFEIRSKELSLYLKRSDIEQIRNCISSLLNYSCSDTSCDITEFTSDYKEKVK